MGLFSKQTSHYVFDYKPIYYDPKKESREKRFKNIRAELGIKETEEKLHPNYKADINFRDTARFNRNRRDRNSTVRLLAILVILGVTTYIFLYTDVFDKITNFFVS